MYTLYKCVFLCIMCMYICVCGTFTGMYGGFKMGRMQKGVCCHILVVPSGSLTHEDTLLDIGDWVSYFPFAPPYSLPNCLCSTLIPRHWPSGPYQGLLELWLFVVFGQWGVQAVNRRKGSIGSEYLSPGPFLQGCLGWLWSSAPAPGGSSLFHPVPSVFRSLPLPLPLWITACSFPPMSCLHFCK